MGVTSDGGPGGGTSVADLPFKVAKAPFMTLAGELQSAVDAADADDVPILVMEPGVYEIEEPLVLPMCFELMSPGQAIFRTLQLDLNGVVIRAKAGAWTGGLNDPVIDASALGCRVHGLIVDGNGEADGGIKIAGMAAKVEDNDVIQCLKYHIWISNSNTGATDNNAGVVVRRNDVWGDTVAGTQGIIIENEFGSPTSAATDCWILENSIAGCRISAISAGLGAISGVNGSTWGLGGLMVKDNHTTCSTDNTGANIYLQGVVDFQVTGNTVDSVGNGKAAIELATATNKGIVANNNIIGQSSGIVTEEAAILVSSGGTSEVIIANNFVNGRMDNAGGIGFSFGAIVRFANAPARCVVKDNIGRQITGGMIVAGTTITTPRSPSSTTYESHGNFAFETSSIVQRDGVRRYGVGTVRTTTYTIDDGDDIVLCNHATVPFTVTLPPATNRGSRTFLIKNVGAAAVTVDGNGAETIDGVANKVLSQWEWIEVICNGAGANWYCIGHGGPVP